MVEAAQAVMRLFAIEGVEVSASLAG